MKPELNHIYTGNCLDVMKGWPANFVDTIITDPPYGLSFMGKEWDHGVPGPQFWAEALRIAKPGAMFLAFGGTRTYHRLAVAIEDAGWQIRDCLMWLYGSGFPKSHDISKALDEQAGVEREIVGYKHQGPRSMFDGGKPRAVTLPVTRSANHWNGYGTALKPAWEPIIMAMKPLDGTFAQNAETWGVAGLNVDGARIHSMDAMVGRSRHGGGIVGNGSSFELPDSVSSSPAGRWPANLLLDEVSAGMLPDDASRFFYVAKAATAERNEGCDDLPIKSTHRYGAGLGEGKHPEAPVIEKNNHPTVKPLDLMKYLVNLTKSPTGGIVLDPFSGSGTTLWAAETHNRPWLGIEMNPEYVAIAEARLAMERSQLKLPLGEMMEAVA